MKTVSVSYCFSIFIITLQLSICLGQSISDQDFTRTCRKDYDEAGMEQRLLEKMRPAFVSLISSMNRELSDKIDDLTRQMEQLTNESMEERLLEKMRPAFVSLISSMNRELSDKIDDLTRQMEQLTNESKNSALQCPGSDWKVFQSSCYFFSSTGATWQTAKKKCESFGRSSHLVSITSESINNFIVAKIKPSNDWVWTGGNDLGEEGNWIWDFNKERMRYTNWYVGEPNNHRGEHCLQLRGNYKGTRYWNDGLCHSLLKFVCQKNF